LKKIADASARSLIAAIRENIELGSSVRTDTWKGYTNISSSGYTHIKVNQSSEIGEKMLSLAHRVASLLKRWLQGTHQGAIDSHYLDYYLDEFSFRFNRRSSQFRGKLFYRLIQQSVTVEPVRSKDIGYRSNAR